MTTPAFVELENKEGLIAELREKFQKKYIEPRSPKLAKFDERDVNRIFNDDLFTLSFLNWKKGIINDSLDMVVQVFEWRKENEVGDISVESVGAEFMERGICYIHGRGLDGKRIMCIIGRLQTKNDKEKVRKLLIFWLERLQRTEAGQHITFILDTHKTAMSNVDLGMIRFIIDSFSTYFPDLLERIIILDMPWIMNAIWKVVKQWMTEEQRSRVVFCSRQELSKFIAKDQLPTTMNGTSEWKYSFPPFPDDLPAKSHFKDDPMNFKPETNISKDETNETHPSSESSESEEVNEVAPLPSTRTRHNSLPSPKSSPRKEANRLEDSPKANDIKRKSKTRRRSTQRPVAHEQATTSQSPISSKGDHENRFWLPQQRYRNGLRQRHTSGSMQNKESSPQSFISFEEKSPFRDAGDGDVTQPVGSPFSRDSSDEITLRNLLIMSPVSTMRFERANNRLETFIQLRNPNEVTENISERMDVSFKIKTTSPDKYHVKPSVGILRPGESMSIRIYIEAGHETSMHSDRFLLLYKTIPAEDERPSHGDIVKFWKSESSKTSHFEHRVFVAGRRTSNTVESKEPTDLQTNLFPEHEADIVSSQVQQQITLLNNKVIRLESDSRWIRRRLRHTMGLLFVVILLLLILLKEIIVLSSRVSRSQPS